MAQDFPIYAPAFRLRAGPNGTGTNIGTLTLTPTVDRGTMQYGFLLDSVDPDYTPELLGPWLNSSWGRRWRLLGVRVSLDMKWALLIEDLTGDAGKSGLSRMRDFTLWSLDRVSYFVSFNLFSDNANSAWRDVRVTSPFSPKKAGGKQTLGFTLDMTLETVDLVQPSNIGYFKDRTW
jgi:hypothetical protein